MNAEVVWKAGASGASARACSSASCGFVEAALLREDAGELALRPGRIRPDGEQVPHGLLLLRERLVRQPLHQQLVEPPVMAEALRRFAQMGECGSAPLHRIDQPRQFALGCDIERGERAYLAREGQRLRQVARILVNRGCGAQPVRAARTLPRAVEQWPGVLEVPSAGELAGREQHQAGVVRISGERCLQLPQPLGRAVQLFQPEVQCLPRRARQPAEVGDARTQIRNRALLLAHLAARHGSSRAPRPRGSAAGSMRSGTSAWPRHRRRAASGSPRPWTTPRRNGVGCAAPGATA